MRSPMVAIHLLHRLESTNVNTSQSTHTELWSSGDTQRQAGGVHTPSHTSLSNYGMLFVPKGSRLS